MGQHRRNAGENCRRLSNENYGAIRRIHVVLICHVASSCPRKAMRCVDCVRSENADAAGGGVISKRVMLCVCVCVMCVRMFVCAVVICMVQQAKQKTKRNDVI